MSSSISDLWSDRLVLPHSWICLILSDEAKTILNLAWRERFDLAGGVQTRKVSYANKPRLPKEGRA